MKIIDGKQIAKDILKNVEEKAKEFNLEPLLHIIVATEDPAALKYAELKKKKCEYIGIRCQIIVHSKDETIEGLIEGIQEITDPSHIRRDFPYGVMVQLPLYPHLEPGRNRILNSIKPEHDVDGLSATNLGLTMMGDESAVIPATVLAILEALKAVANADSQELPKWLSGKNIVIINHSNLIGKPLSMSLLNHGATVTVAHDQTTNLTELTKSADILITATGTPGLITSKMVRDGAIVVDVTSIKTESGVVGDVIVDEDLESKVSWITPVPGGIGPLTVACLLKNLTELPTE